MNIVEFCQLWHYIVIYTVQLYTQYITHSWMCIEGYIMDIILAFILTIYILTCACSPSSINICISCGWKMWACIKIEPLKYPSEQLLVIFLFANLFLLLLQELGFRWCSILYHYVSLTYSRICHSRAFADGLDHRERRWMCALVVVAQHYGNSMFLLG